MGKVGSLGKVKFYVKTVKGKPEILSFSNLTRESAVQYEEHPVNGRKALLEFIAPQPEQISMTIVAKAEFGVNPHKVQKKLHEYKNYGTICTFMLGGRRIGAYKWVITNLSDTYQTICKNGKITEMTFAVTLKEYRYKINRNLIASSEPEGGKKAGTKDAKAKSYTDYTIKKGDTLWALAKKYYGDGRKYTRIYNANKKIIANPNRLKIGWVIKIPK